MIFQPSTKKKRERGNPHPSRLLPVFLSLPLPPRLSLSPPTPLSRSLSHYPQSSRSKQQAASSKRGEKPIPQIASQMQFLA